MTERCWFSKKVAHKEKFDTKVKFKIIPTKLHLWVKQINWHVIILKKSHPIYNCESFLKLEPIQRDIEIKRLRLHMNCFKPNHKSQDCQISSRRKCSKRHNILLYQFKCGEYKGLRLRKFKQFNISECR